MVNKGTEKQELIEEIRRRILGLISTDALSETEKVSITRNVLNLIENGKRENDRPHSGNRSS